MIGNIADNVIYGMHYTTHMENGRGVVNAKLLCYEIGQM